MVDVKSLVPESYRESRDFRVFLKLLDIVVNTTKYDIDNWIYLYDPLLCPDGFLPLLADLIGYKYDTSLSVKENRIIMSEFPNMILHKGSEIGLRQAAVLSLNAQLASNPSSKEYQDAVNELQNLEIVFVPEDAEIIIYYSEDLQKLRDLMDYVRPVGTVIKFVPTIFPDPESDLAISATVDVSSNKYTIDDSKIGTAQIGKSVVGKTFDEQSE